MHNILITGGAGFIGSNLANRLVGMGFCVAILDNLSPQIHGRDPSKSPLFCGLKDKCEFIQGDVKDRSDWLKALAGKDTLIHLAAETGTGQSMYEIAHYTNVNISGTSLMLDILIKEKNSIERMVVASSRAIYGEGKYRCVNDGIVYPGSRSSFDMGNGHFNPICPICGKELVPIATDEESRINPGSIYGITKQVQEQLVLMFGRMTGMPVAALRYQNVYGPGQSLKNPYTGILSIFSTSMLSGNPIDIFEDGEESRDFVYIDDVVSATILALQVDKGINAAVNVGSGIPISVMHVAETLKRLYSTQSKITISGKYRVGDIRHNFADLSFAQKAMGYKPEIFFEDGIKKFADWVKTQELCEDRYQRSLMELVQKGLLK